MPTRRVSEVAQWKKAEDEARRGRVEAICKEEERAKEQRVTAENRLEDRVGSGLKVGAG